MSNQTMLNRTKTLLQQHKGHWRSICTATGLDYEWLNKLARGKINDPGVNKIQKLHDHLAALEAKTKKKRAH